jgi:hypothetical protein
MSGDGWINGGLAVRLQRLKGALFVGSHEPAVTGHIGGENGGQPPFL